MATQKSTQLELFPQEPKANENRRRFSPDEEQAIIAEYRLGLSAPQIAKTRGCGHALVFRLLRRHGESTRTMSEAKRGRANVAGRIFTQEEEAIIKKEYEAGTSTCRLATKWKCTARTINFVVLRSGGRIRCLRDAQTGKPMSMPLRCALNEKAFENAERDPIASYFAGLLFADGCVEDAKGNQRPDITLRLKASDVEMVRAFQYFVGSSHKLRITKSKGGFSTENSHSASLSVASKKMAADLARLGVLPRKSLTAQVPDFLIHNRDWWRGVIDGDGWVYFSKRGRIPELGLCGTKQTCEAFLEFARAFTHTRVQPQPSFTIWGVRLAHLRAIHVAHALYSGCAVALARKLEAAKRMIALGVEKGILHP